MTSLVIVMLHGGESTLKMTMRPAQSQPDVITIGVSYNSDKNVIDKIVIFGSTLIEDWMKHKDQWFQETSDDPTAFFKQLLTKAITHYSFTADQICFCAEGNLGVQGGEVLGPVVLNLLNHVKPAYALLPTGTPECCKFINYWAKYHGYSSLKISDVCRNLTHDYYSEEELKADARFVYLTDLMQGMVLTGQPPSIISFAKQYSPIVIKELLNSMNSLHASPVKVVARGKYQHVPNSNGLFVPKSSKDEPTVQITGSLDSGSREMPDSGLFVPIPHRSQSFLKMITLKSSGTILTADHSTPDRASVEGLDILRSKPDSKKKWWPSFNKRIHFFRCSGFCRKNADVLPVEDHPEEAASSVCLDKELPSLEVLSLS